KQELHPEFTYLRLGNFDWHSPESWSKILGKETAMHEVKINEKYMEDLALIDLVTKEKTVFHIECSQLGKGSDLIIFDFLWYSISEKESICFLFVSNNNNNDTNVIVLTI
ncbi:hypothetical protein RFI_01862, partial [Reticulomyxa filosa]